jgi:hypothetical protein
MKKSLIIAILVLVSCTNEKQKQFNKVAENVEIFIKDNAFRENQTVTIYEIETVELVKVTGNYINEDYVSKLLEASKSYMKLAKVEGEKIEGYTKLMTQYNMKLMIEKGNESKIKMDEYIKLSKNFVSEGSKLLEEIDALKIDSVYRAKVFLKASFKKEDYSENVLDTFYYILNNKLEIKPFRNIDN